MSLARVNDAAQAETLRVAELKQELMLARKAHDEDMVARQLAPKPSVPTPEEAVRAALEIATFQRSEAGEVATNLLRILESHAEKSPKKRRSGDGKDDDMAVDGSKDVEADVKDGSELLETAAEAVRPPGDAPAAGDAPSSAASAASAGGAAAADPAKRDEALRKGVREKLVAAAAKTPAEVAAAAGAQQL